MRSTKSFYHYGFLLPAGIVFFIFFILPTLVSFFFSFTRWNLTEWDWIGFENFRMFLQEPSLNIGFKNTFIYAVMTSGMKVIFALLLAVLLTAKLKTKNFLRSVVFFPTLISTVAVGITFSYLMHPSRGLINAMLGWFGIQGPNWLGDPSLAIYSVALVDIWKGVGFATVIYIAGIMSIPSVYYEAVSIDGGGPLRKFWHITLPLIRPAMNSIIMLSFIGGLRTFDLVWTMTKGGPGFSSDLIASIIYKQYQAGFYGLSTAGNVILFLIVAILVVPLYRFLTKREVEL